MLPMEETSKVPDLSSSRCSREDLRDTITLVARTNAASHATSTVVTLNTREKPRVTKGRYRRRQTDTSSTINNRNSSSSHFNEEGSNRDSSSSNQNNNSSNNRGSSNSHRNSSTNNKHNSLSQCSRSSSKPSPIPYNRLQQQQQSNRLDYLVAILGPPGLLPMLLCHQPVYLKLALVPSRHSFKLCHREVWRSRRQSQPAPLVCTVCTMPTWRVNFSGQAIRLLLMWLSLTCGPSPDLFLSAGQ